MVLLYLRGAPDAVSSVFNVTDYDTQEDDEEDDEYSCAYECLYESNRPDLIDRFYARESLDTIQRYYMNVMDYVQGKVVSMEKVLTIPNSVFPDAHEIFTKCVKYIRKYKLSSGCTERLHDIMKRTIPNWKEALFSSYIEDGNLEMIKSLLAQEICLNTICVYTALIREQSPIRSLLVTYIFGQKDYSSVRSDLWKYCRPDNIDIFVHIVKHGYQVRPKVLTGISEELVELLQS